MQEGEIGCEGGDSVVGTGSVAVSPPGDTSDTGEEVSVSGHRILITTENAN